MKWNPFNRNIGLALGGGAAKGIAHIGVLKAIEEEGLSVTCISGTSVGALVASYYAFGKSIDDIMSIGSTLNLSKMINWTVRKKGFFSTDAIMEMVLNDLGDRRIEESNIPLAICTTDIVTGQQVVFKKGPLAPAICASMAVPGLFIPVDLQGRTLVDGGIVENVPISPLEKMGAGIIIGVNLNHSKTYPVPNSTLEVVANSVDIGMDLRTREQLKKADIRIELDLRDYSRTNNAGRTEELFKEGYFATKRKIKAIRRYRKANLLHFVAKVISELVPLKIPELFKRKLSEFRANYTFSRWGKVAKITSEQEPKPNIDSDSNKA